jgi:hypothetical protein
MSLSRLNTLLMSNILPFNFGMDYQGWVRLWDEHPDTRGTLCPTDPHTWNAATRAEVDERAAAEVALHNRLMALPDGEFRDEVARLTDTEGVES